MPPGMPARRMPAMKSAAKRPGASPTKGGAVKSPAKTASARVPAHVRRHSSRWLRAARQAQLAKQREDWVASYKANLLKSLQIPGSTMYDGRRERWDVKVGLDPEAKEVFRPFDAPIPQDVEDFAMIPRKEGYENTSVRYEPYETTLWVVEGTIVAFGVAPDGDYDLVIRGGKPENLSPADEEAYKKMIGTHFTDTILAAIPDPANVASSSAWRANIEVVRYQFDQEFQGERHPGPVMRRLLYPVKVRLTGVGFFDFDHGQEGRAPNAIAIHPVLKMEWL